MLCPPRWACLRSCLPACLPIWSGVLCPPRWSCLLLSAVLCPVLSAILAGMPRPPRWAVSRLVSHLVWDALSASLVLSFSCLDSGLVSQLLSLFCLVACLSSGMLCLPPLGLSFSCLWSCLPACLPSGLGCCVRSLALSFSFLRSCLRPCLPSWLGRCVRLAGLSPVLSPSLSPIWSGMLCPPRWSCLSLVCGLVCGLVSHLGWDAVSASLGCLRSCLPACLPSGLGCPVRLPGLVFLLSRLWSCLPAFVFVLSRSLSCIWDAVSTPPGLVFFLSLVLSPSLSGMLCLPSWLVSQANLSRVFCPILLSSWSGVSVLWACLQNFMCDLCNRLGSTVV